MNYNLEKSPKDRMVITRKLVMLHEINLDGMLFGGVLHSWIDQTAYMTVQIHSGRPSVALDHSQKPTRVPALKLDDKNDIRCIWKVKPVRVSKLKLISGRYPLKLLKIYLNLKSL